MKRLWICDFCSKSGINPMEMKVHEGECCMNPAVKKLKHEKRSAALLELVAIGQEMEKP